jgi:esterase/lipase superfamily enzyme
MSLFSRILPARHSLSILGLAAILFMSATLTGCSEAPKIPGEPKSADSKSDGPTAGAPAPRDEEKQASGGEDAPGSAPAPAAEAPKPKNAEPPSVASAEPPPPPPPPATVQSPAPAAQPGAAPSDDEVTSRDRGLGTTAQPPVALADKPKSFDVVPVFYGTDRTVEPDPKRLQFGTERGHKLQIGRALVTVPTAHKVPNIERPWVVELPYFKYKIYEEKEDPAQHFTMQEIAALSKEQLLTYVKERLAKSAKFKDHAFVFVHGFNTSFDAAIYRTAQIAYDLKFDGAPFVYSWPSGGKVASYTYDRGSAEQAEPQLTEFLDLVIKESGAKSISLIAHSMGNELLLRVLERMKPSVPKGVVISQVILAAPDVDRDKFTNIAREITNFAKGVTLYAASNDKALGYSARFWGGVPRAGDVPASGPLIIPGVDTIDVTAVSTDSLGLNHSGYAESKTLLNDIGLLLQTGERPPDKRVPILLKVESASGLFWRYPESAGR